MNTSNLLDHSDDSRVMTFKGWCELNALSLATGRRILASDDAPTVLQLSARRIGIRYGDNRRWQEQRARVSAA